jgi:hypothetical protein
MNIQSNTDEQKVTTLVETSDVTILATVDQDADDDDVLAALAAADQQLAHGRGLPMHHPDEIAADGGTQS